MPKIPLYQQQVGISDQSPGVMYDASAEIQAIGQIANDIAGGVENLGKGVQKGIERFQTLEDESSIADANRRMVEFQNDMILEKQKALEDPNVGYKNYEEKVLQPKINEFRNGLLNSGYSKRVAGRILETADMDFSNMIKMERVDRVKKATENHVANIQQEAGLMIMTESRYEDGVQRINDMVTNGYITKTAANNFISESNKAYFTTKAEAVTNESQINDLMQSPRFKQMSQNDQGVVLQKANQAAQKYYNETTAKNIDEAARLLNAGELDSDQIQALDIPDYEKRTMLLVEAEQIRTLKRNYVPEDGSSIQDLEALDRRIENLFLGKVKNPTKEFNSIFEDVMTSGADKQIINSYIEVLVDRMKTPQGYDVFVRNQEKGLYDSDDAWAWEIYWKQYDDATTHMPSGLKKRDLVTRKNDFLNYIKNARRMNQTPPELLKEQKSSAFGTRFGAFEVARTANTQARDEYLKAGERFNQLGGTKLLEFDNDGNLKRNSNNEAAVFEFINNQFDDYLEYRTRVYFNKAMGVPTPLSRETLFQEYYIPPDTVTGDPGVRRIDPAQELTRQGLIEG